MYFLYAEYISRQYSGSIPLLDQERLQVYAAISLMSSPLSQFTVMPAG